MPGWSALRALAVACAVVLAGCRTPPMAATLGRQVPPYEARTLAGEAVSLMDLRGEVVLLNVWATWCLPCRREMPSLEALQRDFAADGFRVVAVSIDPADSAGEIDAFLSEHGISFTVLHDPDQRISRAFRIRGVPETFLIDRSGTLVKHWIGRVDGRAEAVRGPVRAALRGSPHSDRSE